MSRHEATNPGPVTVNPPERDTERAWLLRQASVQAERIERCQREEAMLLDYEAERARRCWDVDREGEAAETGAGLARRPDLVVRRLERTPQGIAWLVTRWEALAGLADAGWNESQTSLAFDLQGVPRDLRGPSPCRDGETPAELVARELARLERLNTLHAKFFDDIERDSAATGTPYHPSPALRRLRRYEAACRRDLRWIRDTLGVEPEGPSKPKARAEVRTEAAPPPAPARPSPAPPPPIPARPVTNSLFPTFPPAAPATPSVAGIVPLRFEKPTTRSAAATAPNRKARRRAAALASR